MQDKISGMHFDSEKAYRSYQEMEEQKASQTESEGRRELEAHVKILEKLKEMFPGPTVQAFGRLTPDQQGYLLNRIRENQKVGVDKLQLINDIITTIEALENFNQLGKVAESLSPEEVKLKQELDEFIEAVDIDDFLRQLEEMMWNHNKKEGGDLVEIDKFHKPEKEDRVM